MYNAEIKIPLCRIGQWPHPCFAQLRRAGGHCYIVAILVRVWI